MIWDSRWHGPPSHQGGETNVGLSGCGIVLPLECSHFTGFNQAGPLAELQFDLLVQFREPIGASQKTPQWRLDFPPLDVAPSHQMGLRAGSAAEILNNGI